MILLIVIIAGLFSVIVFRQYKIYSLTRKRDHTDITTDKGREKLAELNSKINDWYLWRIVK